MIFVRVSAFRDKFRVFVQGLLLWPLIMYSFSDVQRSHLLEMLWTNVIRNVFQL